jgi:hypothetical protein
METNRTLRARPGSGIGALCALVALGALACSKGSGSGQDSRPPDVVQTLPGHGATPIDTAEKEAPRLVPAEAYLRSYLSIFGGLAPVQAQAALQSGGAQLFDNWTDYLGALGFPDYRTDLPRNGQTNALMVATFERLGVALCDRALERDLKSTPAVPVAQRLVFNFDPPADAGPSTLPAAQFAPLFDQLHRLFLGYPAALAPTDRVNRFYQLYQATVTAQAAAPNVKTLRFKPNEAGWAAVCYGLVRHPEFHFY